MLLFVFLNDGANRPRRRVLRGEPGLEYLNPLAVLVPATEKTYPQLTPVFSFRLKIDPVIRDLRPSG
jgi:hypothetical protein